MKLSDPGRTTIGSFPGTSGDERQRASTHVDVTVEPAGRDDETGERQVRIVAKAPFPASPDDRMEWVLPEHAARRFTDAIEDSLAEG